MNGPQPPPPSPQHRPVYPSPPLTENRPQREPHTEQNQKPPNKRIREISPQVLAQLMETVQQKQNTSGVMPSSVMAAMIQHQLQLTHQPAQRPGPLVPLSQAHEQRRQHRPPSPTQHPTHFTYEPAPSSSQSGPQDAPPQPHSQTQPEHRPPGQGRTQSEPTTVYRDARSQSAPQPPPISTAQSHSPHHNAPLSASIDQPRPSPSTATAMDLRQRHWAVQNYQQLLHQQLHQQSQQQREQNQQYQMALARQQELKRLSLASAGAAVAGVSLPAVPTPATVVNTVSGGCAPGSAHLDSVNLAVGGPLGPLVPPPPLPLPPPTLLPPSGSASTGSAPPSRDGTASAPAPGPTNTNTNTSTSTSTNHLLQALIQHSAAQALAPVRPIFEQAWLETVTNVQREMGRMVHEFDERVRGLEGDVVRYREERNRAREEVGRMGERVERYKEERNKMREEVRGCEVLIERLGREKETLVGVGRAGQGEREGLRGELDRLTGEVERLKRENERLRGASDTGTMETNVRRRLTEEDYDDVDNGFRLGSGTVEITPKTAQMTPTPMKQESTPPSKESPGRLRLEMAKMKEQLEREMDAKFKLFAQGIRAAETESRTTSPLSSHPLRTFSSPPIPSSESNVAAATCMSSTRASPGSSATVNLTEVNPANVKEDETAQMDVDREGTDGVDSGALSSSPIGREIRSSSSTHGHVNGDQEQLEPQAPHVGHAQVVPAGAMPRFGSAFASTLHHALHPSAHPHSAAHGPDRPVSPVLLKGSFGRRGGVVGVSRDGIEDGENMNMNMTTTTMSPLTPSSPPPGSAFRSKSADRPGTSNGNGRPRSINGTPVLPQVSSNDHSPFAEPQVLRRVDAASPRSTPVTPRVGASVGMKFNGAQSVSGTPQILPYPPPPPPTGPSSSHVTQSRPHSAHEHVRVHAGTPGQQQTQNRVTIGNGTPSPRSRPSRFSSPVRTPEMRDGKVAGDIQVDANLKSASRKRGREEFEQEVGGVRDPASTMAYQHQRANIGPEDERARQRIKVEPGTPEFDRDMATHQQPAMASLTGPGPATSSTNGSTSSRRDSWSNIIPSSLPPLQSPVTVDRKPGITSPTGVKSSPNPGDGVRVRPTIWAPSHGTVDRSLPPFASSPSSATPFASSQRLAHRQEPRPGSAGDGTKRAPVAFPFRKPLATSSLNGQQQQKVSPVSPSDSRPSPTSKNKIGINHLDLLYETVGDWYHCRVCKLQNSKESQPVPPTTFSIKQGKMQEFLGHYQMAHPKSCEDLEKLGSAQVAELKQRLKSSRFTGFTLS